MDNRKLDDGERCSKGSCTDGAISHADSGLEIVIIKVSGPPEIDNHTHFVEDRRKIPITLEKTIKKITQNHPNTNKAVLSKIV